MLKINSWIILALCFVSPVVLAQDIFKPIPPGLSAKYKFDLQKNFFENDNAFRIFMNGFSGKYQMLERALNDTMNVNHLPSLTQQLSDLDFDFRKIDLYLFLQYAVNTTNEKASLLEDSLYYKMADLKNLYRSVIKKTSDVAIAAQLNAPGLRDFQYYIRRIKEGQQHELTTEENNLLQPFSYLKSDRFYSELLDKVAFEKIVAGKDTFDLFRDRGAWQNHKDSNVRAKGEQLLYKGYGQVKNELGFGYIGMIKGLNAFSRSKKYDDLVAENSFKISMPALLLDTFFRQIESKAFLNKPVINNGMPAPEMRYTISDASGLLMKSFGQLGSNYLDQASQLLNPANGRMDIAGGPNRLNMQGVASVYPIGVSVFYASNFEGYYIDLMLLAHETGHAVQASLMFKHKVSILNSAGPGYFTESFGKFNELLVAYTLYEEATSKDLQKYYYAKYLERLLVLFGSTEEAAIEYALINGITNNAITNPAALDSVTSAVSNRYSSYKNRPGQSGLWMLLETNFRAPLHNVNDMLASLLSIYYFRQFLADKKQFAKSYERFLQNGYTDSPSNLLKQFMDIDIYAPGFCTGALDFVERALEKIN